MFSVYHGLTSLLRFTFIMICIGALLSYAFSTPVTLEDILINNIFYWLFGAITFYAEGRKGAILLEKEKRDREEERLKENSSE